MAKTQVKRRLTINIALVALGIVLLGVGVWLQQTYASSNIYAFWASLVLMTGGVILIMIDTTRD